MTTPKKNFQTQKNFQKILSERGAKKSGPATG